jgi:hypothetical protein
MCLHGDQNLLPKQFAKLLLLMPCLMQIDTYACVRVFVICCECRRIKYVLRHKFLHNICNQKHAIILSQFANCSSYKDLGEENEHHALNTFILIVTLTVIDRIDLFY